MSSEGWLKKKRFTLICGASGTGKTSFALRYLARGRWDHVFLFDPENEFEERLGIRAARTAAELDKSTLRGFSVFDPGFVFPGQNARAFGFWAEYVYAWSGRLGGRKILVVDEVQNYCTPHAIPPALALALETGRRRDLEILALTNRPNALHPIIWQQTTEVVAFNCPGHTAKERLQEQGFNADEVASLPPLHWISRETTGLGELRGKLEF